MVLCGCIQIFQLGGKKMKRIKSIVAMTLCSLLVSQSLAFADVNDNLTNESNNIQNNLAVEKIQNDNKEKIVGAFRVENGKVTELDPNAVELEYNMYFQELSRDELLKRVDENNKGIQMRGAITNFKVSGKTRSIQYKYQKRACQPLYNQGTTTANLNFSCSATFSVTGNVSITSSITDAIQSSAGISLSTSAQTTYSVNMPVSPNTSKWLEFAPNMDNIWGTFYDYNRDGILISEKWVDAYYPVKLNGMADGVYVVKEMVGRYN